MNIAVIGDNIGISNNLKDIIKETLIDKLEKHLQHFAEDMKNASVRITELERYGYRVNFNMWLPGKKHIFAETSQENLQTAIINLRHEVERQIEDYVKKMQIPHTVHSINS